MPTKLEKINLEQLTEMLETTAVAETLDLGCVLIHRGLHPVHGPVSLISTTGASHAMLKHT